MSANRIGVLAAVLLCSTILADETRQAGPAAPNRLQIARWVKQLGHDDFAIREQASAHLADAHLDAEPALRAAAHSADAEVARRARLLLEELLPLTLQGHTGLVYCVAYSRDGNRIVSASEDRRVKVWDVDRGTEVLSLKGHSGGVNCVAYSPDGNRIVSASSDATVKVWRVRKQR